MNPTERKRLQRSREKSGLVLLTAWVPAELKADCSAAIDAVVQAGMDEEWTDWMAKTSRLMRFRV